MENDPELNGKFLGTISQDFVIVSETLKEAAYQLKVREISEYPIFPIAKVDVAVGQLLIPKEELATKWNYHFSFLEEFVQRALITEEHLEEFRGNFKNPEEFCCLFVVEPEFTKFVFIPYPED